MKFAPVPSWFGFLCEFERFALAVGQAMVFAQRELGIIFGFLVVCSREYTKHEMNNQRLFFIFAVDTATSVQRQEFSVNSFERPWGFGFCWYGNLDYLDGRRSGSDDSLAGLAVLVSGFVPVASRLLSAFYFFSLKSGAVAAHTDCVLFSGMRFRDEEECAVRSR